MLLGLRESLPSVHAACSALGSALGLGDEARNFRTRLLTPRRQVSERSHVAWGKGCTGEDAVQDSEEVCGKAGHELWSLTGPGSVLPVYVTLG